MYIRDNVVLVKCFSENVISDGTPMFYPASYKLCAAKYGTYIPSISITQYVERNGTTRVVLVQKSVNLLKIKTRLEFASKSSERPTHR